MSFTRLVVVGLMGAASACSSSTPSTATPGASDAMKPFSDSLPADSAAAAHGSASASVEAPHLPAMPIAVTECSAADGADYGGYSPSEPDVEKAIEAAGDFACLRAGIRTEAVHACAAKVGTTSVHISTDDLKGPSGCEVNIHGAQESGRRFVVFSTFHREKNAQFWGETVSVELGADGPHIYLVSADPKLGALCPDSGVSGTVAPKELPSGWTGLSGSIHAFLCSGK